MIRKLMKLCKLTKMINHLSEKRLYTSPNVLPCGALVLISLLITASVKSTVTLNRYKIHVRNSFLIEYFMKYRQSPTGGTGTLPRSNGELKSHHLNF